MINFWENVQKPQIVTINLPQFKNSTCAHFFTLLAPNLMQSFKKLMSSLWNIERLATHTKDAQVLTLVTFMEFTTPHQTPLTLPSTDPQFWCFYPRDNFRE